MATSTLNQPLPDLLLIGDLSARSQTPVKTLRYYEELGLIRSEQRTTGGFRQFSPACLQRLAFIKQAKALGLSLQEIGHILAIYDGGDRPCQEVRQTLHEKVQTIEQRIQELSRLKAHLLQLIAVADDLPAADAAICPIIEHSS